MKLNKEDAKDFDKTYIDCQVKVHKMVLKTIDDKLLPNAHSAGLRNHLVAPPVPQWQAIWCKLKWL